MINKSKLDIIAAVAAVGVRSAASAEFIRSFGSLLFMARRFYDAHMQNVQMRLAPTRRLGGSQLRRTCNTVTFANPISSQAPRATCITRARTV